MVKVQTSDGKLIATFWDRVKLLFARKNKAFGSSDLKSAAWTTYINNCVAQEKALYPVDPLTLVVGSSEAAAPTTASSSSSRCSGVSHL
ncbi:hypothetical protein B0H10DRAFT_2063761, partial [Mycena sp. CBHHK59/15]